MRQLFIDRCHGNSYIQCASIVTTSGGAVAIRGQNFLAVILIFLLVHLLSIGPFEFPKSDGHFHFELGVRLLCCIEL